MNRTHVLVRFEPVKQSVRESLAFLEGNSPCAEQIIIVTCWIARRLNDSFDVITAKIATTIIRIIFCRVFELESCCLIGSRLEFNLLLVQLTLNDPISPQLVASFF